MRRVLLLETLHPERHRRPRVELYPFLVPLVREAGSECRWWVVPVPPSFMHVERRFVVDLLPESIDVLAAEWSRWRPDRIVLHDRPSAELRRRIEGLLPDVTIVDLTGFRGRWERVGGALEALGLEPTATRWHPGDLTIDIEEPLFERLLLQPVDPVGLRSIRIACLMTCAHREPVADNPIFAGLSSELVERHVGCSFCKVGVPMTLASAVDPVERAVRQIEAHQASLAEDPGPFEYLLIGEMVAQAVRLIRAVLGRDIRPSTFVTMMRADALVRASAALENLLPRMKAPGHRIEVVSVGAENFSAEENRRFNKHITPRDLWACHAALQSLEATYPDQFGSVDEGYFASILFTPWTRPADLRCNLEAARTLGGAWLTRALGKRLQLLDGTPIVDLARRDRLTDMAGDAVRNIDAISIDDPSEGETSWDFADARTARAHEILVRLEPAPEAARIPDSDPLRIEVRELQAELPPSLAQDIVELAIAILDAVERLGATAPVANVFADVRRHASADIPATHNRDSAPTKDPRETDAAAGAAGVSVVHLTPGLGEVVVRTGPGEVISRAIGFAGGTHPIQFSAGAPSVEIAADGAAPALAALPLCLRPGEDHTLALVPGPEGPRLVMVAPELDIGSKVGVLCRCAPAAPSETSDLFGLGAVASESVFWSHLPHLRGSSDGDLGRQSRRIRVEFEPESGLGAFEFSLDTESPGPRELFVVLVDGASPVLVGSCGDRWIVSHGESVG